MALKALSLSKTIEYQSNYDDAKGTEDATIFKIGAIPQRVYGILKDKGSKCTSDPNNPEGITMDFRPNDIAFDMVRIGVKDIANFNDPDTGNALAFKTQKVQYAGYLYEAVHMDIMNVLSLDIIRELAFEIRKLNDVSEEEEKNSEG